MIDLSFQIYNLAKHSIFMQHWNCLVIHSKVHVYVLLALDLTTGSLDLWVSPAPRHSYWIICQIVSVSRLITRILNAEAIFHPEFELALEIGAILELQLSFALIPILEGTARVGMKRIISTNEVPFGIFGVRTQPIIKPAFLGKNLSSFIRYDYVSSATP